MKWKLKWKKRKLKWKNDIYYQKPRKITGLKKIIYEFKTIYFKKGRKIISIDYDEYIKALDKGIKRLKDIRNRFRFPSKRKYGHNPDLIERDEEIVIDYNVLRQEDVIPGECLRSLALEYELSPATIDDIVKGKTKRKKLLG
jgi:hypothetical protein